MYEYSGRQLTRDVSEARLGGVAAGVARYFQLDPLLVRVLWVVAVPLTGGLALLAYFGLWLALPPAEAPAGDAAVHRWHSGSGRQAGGFMLLAIGAIALASQLHVFYVLGRFVLPFALIAAGAALLLRHRFYS